MSVGFFVWTIWCQPLRAGTVHQDIANLARNGFMFFLGIGLATIIGAAIGRALGGILSAIAAAIGEILFGVVIAPEHYKPHEFPSSYLVVIGIAAGFIAGTPIFLAKQFSEKPRKRLKGQKLKPKSDTR
jgi:hypothetical protein